MTKETLAQKQARLKGIAIAAAETVYHYRLIARSININEDTLINWRNADEPFSEQLEQGRFRFLQKKIKIAKPEFLLERLDPETFKLRTENKTEIILPKPILDVDDVRTDDSN